MHTKSVKYFNRKSSRASSFDFVIFALGWQYGLYSVFVLVIFREYAKNIVPISVLNFLFKCFPDEAVRLFKMRRFRRYEILLVCDMLLENLKCEVNVENKIARFKVVLGLTLFH